MRAAPSGFQYRDVRSAAFTGPGKMRVVASDESTDRYGDIIRVSGWDLKNYRANPIVLFGHDAKSPVGTADVYVQGTQLMADITLAD